MNINKSYKLEAITAGKNDNRKILESIYVYENGRTWAVATNGKALAKVPCTIEGEELKTGNSIKASDFKFQRSNPAIKKQDNMFCALEPLNGEFPTIQSIFPKGEATATIGLNIALLTSLCKALGAENVKLEIYDNKTAIKVSSTSEDEAHGLIMPVRL